MGHGSLAQRGDRLLQCVSWSPSALQPPQGPLCTTAHGQHPPGSRGFEGWGRGAEGGLGIPEGTHTRLFAFAMQCDRWVGGACAGEVRGRGKVNCFFLFLTCRRQEGGTSTVTPPCLSRAQIVDGVELQREGRVARLYILQRKSVRRKDM